MKKYGLIGYPLTHSFSKKYFQQKFVEEGLDDCIFDNYEMEDIEGVKKLIDDKEVLGFCITIPHKKNILPYLDSFTEEVASMQACNCVRVKNQKLIGYNTDIAGFRESFAPNLKPHHKNALVLGTGGASAAVKFVLNQLGIEFLSVSRNTSESAITYAELNEAILQRNTIIINCTPLGTYPADDTAPDLPYKFITNQHYLFDLVYNPPLTRFLSLGKERGATIQNGYSMLTI